MKQRNTPLWAGAAVTSRSEDEEVPTSSEPLTNTNGGYEMRIYDQVVLRAMGEAQSSPLSNMSNYRPQPRKKQCARHTKPEGVGPVSPLGCTALHGASAGATASE